MAFRLARGCTLTARVTPVAVSRIMISDFTTEPQRSNAIRAC
jgi:hypothetical protein